MIRVYIDWNAFSRLDDNDEIYRKASSFLINNSKYIIPFSHAHILDIHRSYLKVGIDNIKGKLDILQKYSKDLMITDKDRDELEFLSIYVTKAMEMQIETYDLHKSLNIDKEDLSKYFQIFKPLLNFSIPNPISKSNSKEDIDTESRTKEIAKEFLGESETVSLSEIMENILSISNTILEDDKYNEIRDAYQKDLKVNPGKLRDKRFDPIESLDETAKKLKLENFMALHEQLLFGKSNLSLFKRIQELCRQLDFNGFFQDIIKKGHHLDNIETDLQHIGYASTCDIFISADNNVREKAKLAYKLLDIDVKVFTPKDFVEFTEQHLDVIEDGYDFLNFLFWLMNEEPSFVFDNINYHYVPSYVLEYFNVVSQLKSKNTHLILEKLWSPNRISTFTKEIIAVRDILLRYYGNPYHEQNNIGDPFYGICWMTKDLILIKLIYSERNLKLEIIQCRKMRFWERYWNKFKNSINKLIPKTKSHVK